MNHKLIRYRVQRPYEQLTNIDDLSITAEDAWRQHLGVTDKTSPREILRAAQKASSMEGVVLVCYRVSWSGVVPNHGIY